MPPHIPIYDTQAPFYPPDEDVAHWPYERRYRQRPDSIAEWTLAANVYCQNKDVYTDQCLIRSTLCGRETVRNAEHRVYSKLSTLAASRDAALPLAPEADFGLHRDYDSVFGSSTVWPLDTDLEWQPYPNFRDTFTNNIHFEVNIRVGRSLKDVPAHHIPNICIGTFANRGKLYVAFPAHYHPSTTGQFVDRRVPVETLEHWYEDVVRPSIQRVRPDRAESAWPSTYKHASMIPSHRPALQRADCQLLGRQLLYRTRQTRNPNFYGLLFFYSRRGIKELTTHDPRDRQQRLDMLDVALEGISPDAIEEDTLQIDVGIELAVDGHCVLPLRQSHHEFLRCALPHAPPEVIEKQLRTAHWQTFPTAQLSEVAGCSGPLLTTCGNATAFKLYHTDKNATQEFSRSNIFSPVSAEILLSDKALGSFIDTLSTVAEAVSELSGQTAAGEEPLADEETHIHTGCLRIEVTTDRRDARRALKDISYENLQPHVIIVTSKIYWCVSQPSVTDLTKSNGAGAGCLSDVGS